MKKSFKNREAWIAPLFGDDHLSENDLNAFIEGSESGFKVVFKLYYHRILYFAIKLLSGNRPEAEDITSIAFTNLFKFHKKYVTEKTIITFLYLTVRNKCIDHFRWSDLRGIREWRFEFLLEDDEFLIDSWIELEIIEQETLKIMHESINKLPKKCRQVIRMILKGEKSEAIARKLSISMDTVRSQKRRAIELLRIKMAI